MKRSQGVAVADFEETGGYKSALKCTVFRKMGPLTFARWCAKQSC